MESTWTADVVAKMHILKMSNKDLAKKTGYAEQYISMLLNGHRDTEKARQKIFDVLNDESDRAAT